MYINIYSRGQCDSLKSSASTETTGLETPELSMVLEKAAGTITIIFNIYIYIYIYIIRTFYIIILIIHWFNYSLVLLTSNEFSSLGLLLTDYESRDISVEAFAKELLKLISDEEKVI